MSIECTDLIKSTSLVSCNVVNTKGKKMKEVWISNLWLSFQTSFAHFFSELLQPSLIFYIVTWNVKTYVSHSLISNLKCRMCQKWLKWCSDSPTSPKLQLDFLDLENFLVKVWGGGGGARLPPPTTTPKLQLNFLDLKFFLVKVWGGGGGGVVWCQTPPPPHHHP